MIVARRAESLEDRRAVAAVAHAATHPERPIEHFTSLRLTNPRRADAAWWLLEEGGRPVCSLVVYALAFALEGRVVPGYGIGAVSTIPEARRRGHAAELCRRAIADAEEAGRPVGLLYSAIPPAYYERLEFRTLPAWDHVCEKPAELAASGPRETLLPLDPYRAWGRLAEIYERHHGAALHIHRDAVAFERNHSLGFRHLMFAIGEPWRGYVRMSANERSLEVAELVVPDKDRAATLRALADLAARLSAPTLEGWFDPVPELAPFFTDRGRSDTLPMVRGTPADPRALFWPSDYF